MASKIIVPTGTMSNLVGMYGLDWANGKIDFPFYVLGKADDHVFILRIFGKNSLVVNCVLKTMEDLLEMDISLYEDRDSFREFMIKTKDKDQYFDENVYEYWQSKDGWI